MNPFAREALTSNRRAILARRLIFALGVACAGLFAFGPHTAPPADAAVPDRKQCWRWIWQDPTHCSFCAFKCKGLGYRCCTIDPL